MKTLRIREHCLIVAEHAIEESQRFPEPELLCCNISHSHGTPIFQFPFSPFHCFHILSWLFCIIEHFTRLVDLFKKRDISSCLFRLHCISLRFSKPSRWVFHLPGMVRPSKCTTIWFICIPFPSTTLRPRILTRFRREFLSHNISWCPAGESSQLKESNLKTSPTKLNKYESKLICLREKHAFETELY